MDKYGKDALKNQDHFDQDDTDSSSEEEDEDAEALTEEVEKDFLTTLSMLKGKDPRIYDAQTQFFQKPLIKASKDSKKKGKKTFKLGDMEREVMLEREGQFEEEEEDKNLAEKSQGRTYVQEQKEIQQSLLKLAEEDNEEEDDLLKPKVKSLAEKKKEAKDYKAWLEHEKELKSLRDFWNADDLDPDEKFLKNYILGKQYLDEEDNESDDNEDHRKVHDSDEGLSEDENNLKKMEEFEHKFNFRFEEPDQDFIKRYPRTVKESMRREDNSRKKKRAEVQERKQREKQQKAEELKQLKAIKRKEIMEKLEKIKKVSGNKDIELKDDDIEGDFDPRKYDERMAEVFASYDDVQIENEDEKPDISDLVEDSDFAEDMDFENWDEWTGKEEEIEEEQEDDQSTSAKLENEKEIIASTVRKKKGKKSKFAEMLEQKRPVFNPDENKSFSQYLDDYYKLDYEDIVAGMPCRFKYRNVQSNDFGLSTEEVLSAPDRELNTWCSLKKTCSYRTQEEEMEDVRVFKGRGNNMYLKKKILPTLYSDKDPTEELEKEKEKKAKKGKNRRKRKNMEDNEEEKEIDNDTEQAAPPSKKRKKKKNKGVQENVTQSKGSDDKVSKTKDYLNADVKMSDDRLKAYGIKPNQMKRKARKKMYVK